MVRLHVRLPAIIHIHPSDQPATDTHPQYKKCGYATECTRNTASGQHTTSRLFPLPPAGLPASVWTKPGAGKLDDFYAAYINSDSFEGEVTVRPSTLLNVRYPPPVRLRYLQDCHNLVHPLK